MTTQTQTVVPKANGGAELKTKQKSKPILRNRAVKLIQRETDCSATEARALIADVTRWLEAARNNPRRLHFMSNNDLASPSYRLFEQVIPHGRPSAPGSAHAAIEAAVLDPTRDEYGIRHDQEEVDEQRYCTVQLCLGVV